MSSNDEGINDAAILLLTLGEEEAAEVMKHMSPKEVQKVGQAMTRLKNIPHERVDAVIEKFNSDAAGFSTLGLDSDGFVKNVLTKALGDDRAALILDRIIQGGDTSGIEGLKWMDPSTVAEMIRNEHPQIIASILVHLDRDHTMAILQEFPERQRGDVILRIATLDGIQPTALRDLNEVLGRMLTGADRLRKQSLGGIKAAAEIMTYAGSSTEQQLLSSIREFDPDLAQKISDEMFTFENVQGLDDRAIQTVLREVPSDQLVTALKGAPAELREKIFRNMSSRQAESLREDLESRGPVKLSEVESAQKEMLKVVKRLAEEGTIAISGKGDDQFV